MVGGDFRLTSEGSELIEWSLQNPNFQSFDLSRCGPIVSRVDRITVKVWVNTCDQFHLLIELDIGLESLQFIGKSVRGLIFLPCP